ncbi:hypothetical protein ACFZB9_28585 [Kitasatospora sp. NPDC008050]|uniref:hypothetical protein n=1 Tax=Kitasatospora sp. NPDC008050 TaxID=3364021 RepID=UPI0036ED151E
MSSAHRNRRASSPLNSAATAPCLTGQCSNAAGLEGLLALISGIVPDVAHFFEGKISQCRRGMTLVSGKVDATVKAYQGSDADAAGQLRSLCPTALSAVPDIGELNPWPEANSGPDGNNWPGTNEWPDAMQDEQERRG